MNSEMASAVRSLQTRTFGTMSMSEEALRCAKSALAQARAGDKMDAEGNLHATDPLVQLAG
jgi:hypothetical protein